MKIVVIVTTLPLYMYMCHLYTCMMHAQVAAHLTNPDFAPHAKASLLQVYMMMGVMCVHI